MFVWIDIGEVLFISLPEEIIESVDKNPDFPRSLNFLIRFQFLIMLQGVFQERRAVNKIDGVHLQRWTVNGWPRFPLERLVDETAFATFLAVLDRIVTETRPAPPVEDAEAPPLPPLPPVPLAVVASGTQERCEHDAQRLHAHGLWATIAEE